MNQRIFSNQVNKLIGKDPFYYKEAQNTLFNTSHFYDIANVLLEDEQILGIAPIVDNPVGESRTKLSFIRDWFMVLTDKRILFASPTLILKAMTTFSFRYSSIASISKGKWDSIKLSITGSQQHISIVSSSPLFIDRIDNYIHIIENRMFS